MFDTVRFSLKLDRELKDTSGFSQRLTIANQSGDGKEQSKFIDNPPKPEDGVRALPRLTYLPDAGRLLAEASLPKVLHGENVSMIGECDLPECYAIIDERVGDVTRASLPSVSAWELSRADYCFAFPVGDRVPDYLQALSELRLPRHKSGPIDLDGLRLGVTWATGEHRARAYSKAEEVGNKDKALAERARGLLRFEVENHSRWITGLAESLGREKIAREMLTDNTARVILNSTLAKLGMRPKAMLRTKTTIMRDLARHYKGKRGERKLRSLWYVLSVLETYGGDVDGLLSRATLYRHKKELSDLGFWPMAGGACAELPALWVNEEVP